MCFRCLGVVPLAMALFVFWFTNISHMLFSSSRVNYFSFYLFTTCCLDFANQVLMKSDDKLLPQQHHKRMQDFGVKLVSLRCCCQGGVDIC